MSSAKWRPFYLVLNVLKEIIRPMPMPTIDGLVPYRDKTQQGEKSGYSETFL